MILCLIFKSIPVFEYHISIYKRVMLYKTIQKFILSVLGKLFRLSVFEFTHHFPTLSSPSKKSEKLKFKRE